MVDQRGHRESVGVNLWPVSVLVALLGVAAGVFVVGPLIEMGWDPWWRRRQPQPVAPTRPKSPWEA